jgi:hypothetical protein
MGRRKHGHRRPLAPLPALVPPPALAHAAAEAVHYTPSDAAPATAFKEEEEEEAAATGPAIDTKDEAVDSKPKADADGDAEADGEAATLPLSKADGPLMVVETRFQRTAYAADWEHDTWLALSIKEALGAEGVVRRHGLDLVVLLDTSPSMVAGGWLAACSTTLR